MEPDSESERAALTAALADALAPLSERMVLIGGMAYNLWREPRYTADVDFTASGDRDTAQTIDQVMRGLGYEITRLQGEQQLSGPDFVRYVKPGTRMIVEFQAAKTPFQELLVRRGMRVTPDQPFRAATPEDLIVLKLVANRSKDHGDLVQLMGMPDLDWDYIVLHAREWDVSDRLEALRRDVAGDTLGPPDS